MKKTLLVTSLAAAMGVATTANAAFTAMGDGNYRMTITGGCFDFGNCQTSGNGALSDNLTPNQATAAAFGSAAGSGISNDGVMGIIDFTLTGGTMTVTSFSQDAYQGTAGGTFYLRSTNLTTMGGSIDGAGNMSFDTTGRQGLAANFSGTLGEQPWNIDNPTASNGAGTGLYDLLTTGTSSNDGVGFGQGFTMTGSILQDTAVNQRGGTLVSAGNIGQAWGASFDGTQYSELFNVTIDLVSAIPVANDDVVAGSVNTPIVINIANDLLANDSHADATETLSFDSFTQPSDAASTVVDNANGTITYTPNPALAAGIGVDSFTYTITDTSGTPNVTATVSVTLAAGTAPTANDDSIAATEDTPVVFNPVLGGGFAGVVDDTDPDAGQQATLFISAVDNFSGNSGTISLAAGTNNLTYTPAVDFNGPDTFNYTVQDTSGLFNSATVTVTVAPVNDAPVCSNVSLTTAAGVALTINVANDLLLTTGATPLCTDAEGDSLSLATTNGIDTTGSNGGTISSNGAGVLTYTPVAGFKGTETFNFIATDGTDNAATNVLTINVADPSLSNFTMLEKAGNVFGGTNDVVIEWDEVSVNTNADDGNGVPTDTNYGIMTIASPQPFFNFNWFAHHVRIFRNPATATGPITFKFDVTCEAADYDSGNVVCNKPLADQGAVKQYITMTLEPGEIGAHILFDWGSPQATTCGQAACDIDVVNVWRENAQWDTYGAAAPKNELWLGEAGIPPALDANWRLVSSDVKGDGVDAVNGSPMLDGPFEGYFANFNYKPDGVGEAKAPITTEISDVGVDSLAFSMGLWSLLAGLLSVFGLRKINNKK